MFWSIVKEFWILGLFMVPLLYRCPCKLSWLSLSSELSSCPGIQRRWASWRQSHARLSYLPPAYNDWTANRNQTWRSNELYEKVYEKLQIYFCGHHFCKGFEMKIKSYKTHDRRVFSWFFFYDVTFKFTWTHRSVEHDKQGKKLV